MKNYIYFTFIIIGIVSCLDNIIDTKPVTGIPYEELITNEKESQMALNGVYDALQEKHVTNEIFVGMVECYGDNFNHIGTFSEFAEAWGNNLQTENLLVERIWRYSYQVIQRSNKIIIFYKQLGSNISEEGKRIMGEAHFVRALIYFKLVNLYGDIPLLLEPIEDDLTNINMPKSTEAKIYEQIIEDLNLAVANLKPLKNSGKQIFANKDAALGLLSKVCLYRGNYNLALSSSKQVILNNSLGLIDYIDLWNPSFNMEGLFRIEQTPSDKNSLAFYFDRNNGGRYEIAPNMHLYNSFEDGDLRKQLIDNSSGNLILTKYNDVSKGTDKFYYMRLAEVYLIYAEANCRLAETNNDNTYYTEATKYYNLVRERAGLANKSLNANNWKTLILQERNVELFGEADRWFDIKRSGEAEMFISAKPSTDFGQVKDKYLLWPIPQYEINSNSALSKQDQNPGY